MRILLVLHSFPPRITAGTEMSALRLAQGLMPLHQVRVLHAEYDLFEPEGKVINTSVEGIAVTKIITHRLFEDEEDTYRNRLFSKPAREVISQFKPHIVHFHHFMNGDASLIDELADADIGVVVTLHDYFTLCGRDGQMLRWDGVRCDHASPETCAQCMARMPIVSSEFLPRFAARNLHFAARLAPESIKQVIRDFRKPADFLIEKFIYAHQFSNPVPGEGPPCEVPPPPAKKSGWTQETYRQRFEFFFNRLSKVELISPSKFLRDMFLKHNYPSARFNVLDNGIPDSLVLLPSRIKMDNRVRFGFVGTPSPVKGVHEILLASAQIKEPHSVHIFGDTSIHPRYGKCLRETAGPNVIFHGGKLPGGTAAMFNQFDVLVLPSVWWENAPVVLREARAFKKPSITSNIGGMAETIKEGVDGWLVKPGDVAELKEAMERLCRAPELVKKMSQTVRPPMRISEVIPQITQIYNRVLRNVRTRKAVDFKGADSQQSF